MDFKIKNEKMMATSCIERYHFPKFVIPFHGIVLIRHRLIVTFLIAYPTLRGIGMRWCSELPRVADEGFCRNAVFKKKKNETDLNKFSAVCRVVFQN